jgi:hypothetical protein
MINLEKRGDTIASVCAVATDPDEEAETPDMEPTDDAAVDNTNTTENE